MTDAASTGIVPAGSSTPAAPASATSAAAAAPSAPSSLPGVALAHDAVAQSAAIAIQDATTYLRAVGSVSAAGIAVCVEQLVKTKNPEWATLITLLNTTVTQASATFTAIGSAATGVLTAFPKS